MTWRTLTVAAAISALWLTTAAVSASLASALEGPGGGVASCRLQETSIRITRDHSDDQGSPVRTCEGTVLVSRCEGTCVSQVQPSISLPHGFLKASSPHLGTSECNCCRETYMNRREIQLQDCFDPNGQKLYGADGSMTIFLEEPQDCSCHKCGG
ncbi:partner of bursicon isoform X1 [Dermacentor albipictus]|uniref:partner of bursicon isoform X1 n=1 Tax=Dermacentor albipictus TaxID=60249 RepID=UPI0031FC26F4